MMCFVRDFYFLLNHLFGHTAVGSVGLHRNASHPRFLSYHHYLTSSCASNLYQSGHCDEALDGPHSQTLWVVVSGI